MAMKQAPVRKGGNRRKGKSRGSHSGLRRGTLPAHKDKLIKQRVELVGEHIFEPRAQVQAVVNEWLVSIGEDPVSLMTIARDKDRYWRWLEAEVPKATGATRRLAQFHHIFVDAGRRLAKIPAHHGQAAAAMAAIQLRAIEDSSKLDGSWNGGGLQVNVNVDASQFGPSPREQLERGEITLEEYRQHMQLMWRSATQNGPPKLVGHQDENGEEQVEDVGEPRGPMVRRGGGGGGGRHGRDEDPEPWKRQADELRVVDLPEDVEWK